MADSNSAHQPHDKYFRGLMQIPEIASAILRERLPKALVARFSNEAPRMIEASFVDESLRGSQSDRLFEVRFKNNRTALIYVLVEHKSDQSRLTPLQLLGYLTEIWKRFSKEAPKAPLPPIFPLVVYNGVAKWNLALDFLGLFEVDEELKEYLLNFRYGMVDLGAITDAELSDSQCARSALLPLKWALRAKSYEEQVEALATIWRASIEMPIGHWRMMLFYVTSVFRLLDEAALVEAARRAGLGKESEMVSIAAQKWLAEGEARGRIEGEARGKAEGQTRGRIESLLRLLNRRFGSIPSGYQKQIESGQMQDLDLWLDRVLDAKTLAEVFLPVGH